MSSYTSSGIDSELWILPHQYAAASSLPPRYSSLNSTRRGKYEKKETGTQCLVYVSAEDRRGHSMFTHWRVQTICTFFFLSFSFCRSIFAFISFSSIHINSYSLFLKCHWETVVLNLSVFFLRKWHRTFEKTHWNSCQVKRRKSNYPSKFVISSISTYPYITCNRKEKLKTYKLKYRSTNRLHYHQYRQQTETHH